MVTSAGFCRTGEVEGVETVELVCVGGLLRWVVNLFYCLSGDLLEVDSLAEGILMLGKLEKSVSVF